MRDRWSMLLVFVLALVFVVGCDVRPFSDLKDDDDNGTEANDDDESEGNQAPIPTASDIVITINTTGTSQVDPNDPDADDTHTFEITMSPANGTAEVDADGEVTYTPDTDFTGNDDLEVTVTDDGDPPRSGTVTIDVMVTATTGVLMNDAR